MGNIVVATAKEYGYSEAQLEIIRQTAAVGCSDFEIAQLLIVAARTGLDPTTRQIYLVKRWNKAAGREIATPQTGIDGYRLTADRTQRYVPGKEPTFQYDGEGNLYSATAYVKKLVGGAWHEIPATAIWAEYVQTTKDGKPTSMWLKMPHLMLGKCAEALALRKAFPAELSGVYTADEMAQADNPDVVEATSVVKIAPVPDPQPAAVPKEPMIQSSTFDKLEKLGIDYYGSRAEWEANQTKIAYYWSNKQAESIRDMTEAEALNAIARLEEKVKEKAAAAEPAPAEG